MGFFDDIAERNDTRIQIGELKETLLKLFRERDAQIRSLRSSSEYRELEEEVFEDFKTYFVGRKFKVTKSRYVNVNGLVASSGDFNIEFNAIGSMQFEIRDNKGLFIQTISIVDVNRNKLEFHGYEHDEEVFIHGISSSDEKQPRIYFDAIKKIEKDIEHLKKSKESKPNLKLRLEEKEMTIGNIVDYLEMLNQELKN